MLYGECWKMSAHACVHDNNLRLFARESQRVLIAKDFYDLCKHNEMFLFPAFALQTTIREMVCGLGWWRAQTAALLREGEDMNGPLIVYRMLRSNKLGGVQVRGEAPRRGRRRRARSLGGDARAPRLPAAFVPRAPRSSRAAARRRRRRCGTTRGRPRAPTRRTAPPSRTRVGSPCPRTAR